MHESSRTEYITHIHTILSPCFAGVFFSLYQIHLTTKKKKKKENISRTYMCSRHIWDFWRVWTKGNGSNQVSGEIYWCMMFELFECMEPWKYANMEAMSNMCVFTLSVNIPCGKSFKLISFLSFNSVWQQKKNSTKNLFFCSSFWCRGRCHHLHGYVISVWLDVCISYMKEVEKKKIPKHQQQWVFL